jgi:acyl-CoA thioesterase-1
VIRRRAFLLATGAGLATAGCGRQPRLAAIAPGATVLALGDSLTFGTGASAGASYPAVLARLTGWNVVNAGVPGDTCAAALVRLPELLQQHAPALVLVSIGGNDFLRRLPLADTRANVRSICQQAAAAGAQVLLVGIPELSAFAAMARSLSDHALYAEIADELKIPLHAGGWAKVLGDAALRSDAIHANDRGYEVFARGLAERAAELGLFAGG